MDKIYIGITDSKKFDDYSKWIISTNKEIEIVRLSYQLDNVEMVSVCNGIIMTGGEDVHPEFYGKLEYLEILNPNQINKERDLFELKVIENALQLKKPLLGICRGLQLTNVFLGGTLIPDIPSKLSNSQHGKIAGKDQLHEVKLIEGSFINEITRKTHGTINSAHHQSADVIGEGLKITAYATLSNQVRVVEALEWENHENKGWLLLVQWHPERIAEDDNFSKSIRTAFLNEVSKQ